MQSNINVYLRENYKIKRKYHRHMHQKLHQLIHIMYYVYLNIDLINDYDLARSSELCNTITYQNL